MNPRVALIYNPHERTALKALYGTAFRAPNAVEAYYEDGGISSIVNPNLRPETVRSYELVGEQAIGNTLRATLAGFYSKSRHLISQDLITVDDRELFTYVNKRPVEVHGLEAEVEGKWTGGLRGRISYAFAETRDNVTGRRLDNSPVHLAKLNLVAPVYRDLAFTGFELQYTSERTTFDGSRTDGFTLVNLTLLAQKFWRGAELSATLYNVFAERFRDPSASFPYAIEQDGRTFRVLLTYRF